MIDQQPIARTVTESGHVVFSVFVHGSAPLHYQWSRDGQLLTDNARLKGATNAVLNIDPTTNSDTGSYSVVVTNASGAITGAPVSLVVSQLLFQVTPMGGTGALLTIFGQVGDVYRIEVSTNFTPYLTNGYATNMTGRAQFFDRDTSGGFRQLRVRLDRMLPVLYPAGIGTVRAYGKLNQAWRFEYSADLEHWSALTTVTNLTGWVTFSDPRNFLPPYNFYRIAPP